MFNMITPCGGCKTWSFNDNRSLALMVILIHTQKNHAIYAEPGTLLQGSVPRWDGTIFQTSDTHTLFDTSWPFKVWLVVPFWVTAYTSHHLWHLGKDLGMYLSSSRSWLRAPPCVKDRTALLSPPCCSSCYHHHVTLLMHLSRCKHINSNMSGYFFPKKEFQGILIFALFDHCGVGPASAHKSSDIVVTHTVVILYTLRFIVSIAWSTSQLFTNMYLFSNVKIFLYTFPGLAICCHCILVLNQHLNAYLIFSFTSRSSPVLRRISCASLF